MDTMRSGGTPGHIIGRLTTSPSTQASARATSTIVAHDLDSLRPHLQAWDDLAVSRGRPFCAPGWMLSWWREARGEGTQLRVVLVFDSGRLIGVGPFFAQPARLGLVELRLLSAGFSHRIGPLAGAGREQEVALALAHTLAELQPRPDSVVFEGIDHDDPWPQLIAACWPVRRPRLRTDGTMDAPEIEIAGGYEQWLAGRERKFRKEARRTARRLEEERVQGSVSTDDTAIDELLRLHHARWEDRGGSNVGDAARRVLAGAMHELGEAGRLKVVMLRGPEGPIAAELVAVAGTVAACWGGGFDPGWSSFAPGTQALLLALRDLTAQGVEVVDLGGGEHAYKLRLAAGNSPLAWRTLFPRGARYPLMRAHLAPKHARLALRGLVHRLPPRWRDLLRRLAGRAPA